MGYIRLVCRAVLIVIVFHMAFGLAKAQYVIQHIHNPAHGTAWHGWLLEQKERFEAENPDLKVQIIAPPGSGSADHFMTLMASGVAVDVSELTLRIAGSLTAHGVFHDLKPYLDRSTVLSFDDYVPVAQEAMTRNGQVWGVPVDLYLVPTHYNLDMFLERGLTTPNQLGDNWDFDHALEISKRLTIDRDGDGINEEWATHHPYTLWVYRNAFENRGIQWFDRTVEPTVSRLNTSGVLEVLQWLADLHLVHNVVDLNSGNFSAEFPKGNFGWSLGTGPNTANLLLQAGVTFNWGVAMPIRGVRQGAYTAVNSFQIPTTSANPDAAFRWIEFLIGSESSWEYYIDATSRLPANRLIMPIWVDWVSKLPNRPEGVENYIFSAIHPDNYVDILSPHYARFETLSVTVIREVIQGIRSPQSALEELHQQMTAMFAGE